MMEITNEEKMKEYQKYLNEAIDKGLNNQMKGFVKQLKELAKALSSIDSDNPGDVGIAAATLDTLSDQIEAIVVRIKSIP